MTCGDPFLDSGVARGLKGIRFLVSGQDPGILASDRGAPRFLEAVSPILGSLGEFLNIQLYRSEQFSIKEQLLHIIVKRFRGGLVFTARRVLYHSTLGSRVIDTKQKRGGLDPGGPASERGAARGFLEVAGPALGVASPASFNAC